MDLSAIEKYWSVLLPIVIREILLMIIALKDIWYRTQFKFANKIIWVLVIVLIQILGPILYLMIEKDRA